MAKKTGRKRDPYPIVKYIPTDYSPKYGWAGNKPALCFEDGRCIIITEDEIALVERPIDIIEKSNRCVWTGAINDPYPPTRFAEYCFQFKKLMSKEVRKILKKILKTHPHWKTMKKTLPKLSEPEDRPTTLGAGRDIIKTLAEEKKMDPGKIRRLLRNKGLRAPYTDEDAIRKALS